MENRFCAFLRGINVKGTSMKMDDLKAAFASMGFANIKTILASGNVIFDSEKELSQEELKLFIEKELSSYFQYDAHVFLRKTKEIEVILRDIDAYPAPKDCHQYALICDSKESFTELKELFDSIAHEPMEQFFVVSSNAFWIVPKGSTLSSEFGSKVLVKKQYKSSLTSRNRNTMEKIYNAMNNPKKN
ncbi:Uncharacterized conserved protein, DUF1697 family [Anaerocolumna jejuensis DSM 15929]|uniref:Uncharacterized conserved protein, DUF1697 family n=1 Tax=Anaerocolumna jejuensis DSM 15929 TaxID=1121322 RepID=A0A1M6JGC6_9FIRM|nr:DUF1697 domain-containing protein [Anaerocolumna jejuensis]SHJ45740.1 Uncharacterized conserved protein, DUF1697 family [Anaerocolumna jejuensis DSM 15929]